MSAPNEIQNTNFWPQFIGPASGTLGSILVEGNSVLIGPATTLNFINGVATISIVGGVATIDISGGGATSAITQLHGDLSATGPGNVTATLATVNANVGSFGSASVVPAYTVNGKGLITAVVPVMIQIAETQVNGLVADLAGKLSSTLSSGNIFVGNASNVATAVAMSGDATLANTGALTLAVVNAAPGIYGDATHVAVINVNAKGLAVQVANQAIAFPGGMTGFAAPTSLVGLAPADGVLFTALRSDATLALDQSISPDMTGIWSFDNSVTVATGQAYLFSDGSGLTNDNPGLVLAATNNGALYITTGAGDGSSNAILIDTDAGSGGAVTIRSDNQSVTMASSGATVQVVAGVVAIADSASSAIALDAGGGMTLTTIGGSNIGLDSNGDVNIFSTSGGSAQIHLQDSAGDSFTLDGNGNGNLLVGFANLASFSGDFVQFGNGSVSISAAGAALSILDATTAGMVTDGTTGLVTIQAGSSGGNVNLTSTNGGIYLSGNGATIMCDGSGSPSIVTNCNGATQFCSGGIAWLAFEADTSGDIIMTTNFAGGADIDIISGQNAELNAAAQVTIGANLADVGANLVIQNFGVTTGAITLQSNQAIQLVTVTVTPSPITTFDFSGSSGQFKTSTGNNILNGTNLALYGGTPRAQATAITAPSGGGVIDAQARTAINAILVAIGKTSGIGITAN